MRNGLQAIEERLEDVALESKEPKKAGRLERSKEMESFRMGELEMDIMGILKESEETGSAEIEVEEVAEASGRPQ